MDILECSMQLPFGLKFYLLVKSSQSQAKSDLTTPLMIFVEQFRF